MAGTTGTTVTEVDILGLQAHATPGWEERTKVLGKIENFTVAIAVSDELSNALTEKERQRLEPKLRLVAEAASYMSVGMLKGTIKYSGDDYDLEQWFSHAIGEGADYINYQMLLFECFRRARDAKDQ